VGFQIEIKLSKKFCQKIEIELPRQDSREIEIKQPEGSCNKPGAKDLYNPPTYPYLWQ